MVPVNVITRYTVGDLVDTRVVRERLKSKERVTVVVQGSGWTKTSNQERPVKRKRDRTNVSEKSRPLGESM